MRALWDRERLNLLAFLNDVKSPTRAQLKIKRKLESIPNELRDMTLYLYYEKCKRKHSIEFFTWFETYRPTARELVTKYVEKLKELVVKENTNLEDFSKDNEDEDEPEAENNTDLKNPFDFTAAANVRLNRLPSLMSQPTHHYLDLLNPEIDDYDMIGINLNSTLLRAKKFKGQKVNAIC